ncbi:redox-sensitive transcriptional activator SoxR [Vibrio sp. 1974]|uniref:redox-sensitive transcriptional activator SoxR n=1 Tax=Vibrio sp. 1974 TaxID=3074584 RepID=UPI00296655E1|nr:redox-sensitive transcriptional activator SoxR [Vibrio sp. 1974]MDW3124002.1 redox-sensitive transcriptional activator SoxR [Vibrio sp. 1974]
MKDKKRFFTIGEAAKRCDVATSTLRFYESKGLISSVRTNGNQRRYLATTLRTISVIRAAQKIGVSLEEIKQALTALPDNRPPTKRDWQRLSKQWAKSLDQKVLEMQRLRNNLDTCIGCGCLSLKSCGIFNPNDEISAHGEGPRFLIEGFGDDDE